MATSSRQSSIFGIEDWRSLYKTYNQADFQSYNFETLRKSFVDYIRQNYPEDFNDYVESSEFIALLDVIAFMGQAISYRNDLNTRENFLDTAERRDSVVRLADLVSYTPKRNEAASGYLKVNSISTTENITDFNGTNLADVVVRWNDSTNTDWQDQFNTILNSLFVDSQKVGNPSNSQTILGVDTDEYTIKTVNNILPVIPFSSTINGQSMDFEVISATSENKTYIYEPSPVLNGPFNILYRNDKMGFASENTGFFFHFKQGTLANKDFTLSDRISNRNVDINVEGINNNDVWLYKLNATTGAVISEWNKVENVYATNTTQNGTDKNYFSVTSRANDQITFNFGDGAFSEIPTGFFRTFFRVSNGAKYVINKNDISGVSISVPYVSRTGRQETATFTLSLTQNVSNASSKESIDDIKRNAPARYYTQNRMVNGEDYNNFPYTTFSSIIKSKSVARSNIGTSRHLDLIDPTAKYSSVNTFNSDGLIYQELKTDSFTFSFEDKNDIEVTLRNSVEPILKSRSTLHLYYDKFNRKSLSSIDIIWNQSTTSTNQTTGYFKNSSDDAIQIGTYVTDNRKHLVSNSLIKFVTPAADGGGEYYFDKNNRLKQKVTLADTDNTVLWASIKSVKLDGTNSGVGNDDNGVGPVVLNNFIPTEAIPSEIIAVYNSDLPLSFEQDMQEQIELYNDFGIGYDEDEGEWYIITSSNLNSSGDFSLDYAQDSSSTSLDASWLMKFEATDDVYTVTSRQLNYYFSSILETRFYYNNEKVFDSKTGKTINDFIKVLVTNTQPSSSSQLVSDVMLDIIGQDVESDGFVDDFKVSVSYTDSDSDGVADDPDFFDKLSSSTDLVFFQTVTDADGLERNQPLSDVESDYDLTTDAGFDIDSYADGQLFYFADETSPYREKDGSTLDIRTDITKKTGRQDLQFQYRHNSGDTKRINPGLTNIIDTYVVTDAYYTAYVKYIQDTTDTVEEPSKPTVSELSTTYQSLENSKMLSDNIVINSVNFKPLFGDKASSGLRADIKVVKVVNSIVSDSEIKSAVISTMNNYFNIDNWGFGDTFFFSELSAYIHEQLGDVVSSVVIVPKDTTKKFGDLYEIKCAANEIFVNAATVDNVKVINSLTQSNLNG